MPRSVASRAAANWVHQFSIVLCETEPIVWRRIQVPADYSFWDLHVAIQDSMGWLDYHLHEFIVAHPKRGRLARIGIPDEEDPEGKPCRAGWNVPVSGWVERDAPPLMYLYDFGDDWHHAVIYEEACPAEPSVAYPRCIAGSRRCPPEDCGGVSGFAEFLRGIADPDHREHDEYLQWVGGAYDPDDFDPAGVRFDDPHARWVYAFQK